MYPMRCSDASIPALLCYMQNLGNVLVYPFVLLKNEPVGAELVVRFLKYRSDKVLQTNQMFADKGFDRSTVVCIRGDVGN